MRLISASSKLMIMGSFACLIFVTSGCLNQELQEMVDKAKAIENGESSADDKTDKNSSKLKVAGKWELDRSATIKASKAELKSPLLIINQYTRDLQKAVLDIDIKEDGSFKCHQTLPGHDEHYSGDWVLEGDQIELNQTQRGTMLEADRLTGTVNEDGTLHLIHVQQGLQVPYRMKRAK